MSRPVRAFDLEASDFLGGFTTVRDLSALSSSGVDAVAHIRKAVRGLSSVLAWISPPSQWGC